MKPVARITVQRSVDLPDKVKLARYRRSPELGPRVLFFTGGTALKGMSADLIDYTHNSIHLITPFDSGGSSAKLRETFKMLAVGDLRNRLMALADRSIRGNPPIFELFAYRMPKDWEMADLRELLHQLMRGKHPLITAIDDPMRKLVRAHLRFFSENMPDDFDLRGASIGNLILAGGYFNFNRHIDPVIYLFTKLVEARGVVRPIISKDYHMVAELADGRTVIGQHNITGKEVDALNSRIKRLSLSSSREEVAPVKPDIREKVKGLIASAELIVYPIGSFYSSVVANLLPMGVGEAVAQNDCPKVYIPNTGKDPEQVGMGLFDAVKALNHYLQDGCHAEVARDRLLNFVLIDSKNGNYPEPLDLEKIKRFGVEVIDVPLVTEASKPYLDKNLVLECMLSLT